MNTYDLIVIGGGPAGYLAGERAAHAGMRVLVAESRSLGGVCLNEGCIPSKTLLHSAKLYDYALHGEKYGVSVSGAQIDQRKVIARKNKVVKTLVAGVAAQLKKAGAEVVFEKAVVKGRVPEGFEVEAGSSRFLGKRLLIATGSAAVVPPIPGLREGMDSGFVLTNREILDLEQIPSELVVIGGGVIGLEMASYFSSVGSKVTVVEMLDHIAGATESEISGILLAALKKKGIDFRLGCRVTGVSPGAVTFEQNGSLISVNAEKVLLSIGRRPCTEGIGLESIGVAIERGAVVTDEHMRTSVPGVYAAGDVNGKAMLAHAAYREAEVAVNHMVGGRDRVRYEAVPSVIYTSPEVASVGETPETAAAKGLDCETVNVSMRFSGRYLAENEETPGICKLVFDRRAGRLVGVHMIGSYCSEIIYGAALMIDRQMSVSSLRELVFPHPTVCEVIREGLFMYGGR